MPTKKKLIEELVDSSLSTLNVKPLMAYLDSVNAESMRLIEEDLRPKCKRCGFKTHETALARWGGCCSRCARGR